MYIRIVPSVGTPETLFECVGLEWRYIAKDEQVVTRDDTIYAFPPEMGDPEDAAPSIDQYRLEIWLWGRSGGARQILVDDAVVYVMNDSGDTIDSFDCSVRD